MYQPPGVSCEAAVNFGTTGLTGILTFSVIDNQGAYTINPTTVGITEFPPGTGVYQIIFTTPSFLGQYTIVWEDADDNTAIESLTITADAPIQVIGSPGEALGPISGWITGADVAVCCDVDYGTDSSVFDQSAQTAQALLFQLSSRLFPGIGVTVARPCRTQCGCPWQVLSRGHIVWNDYGYTGYPYSTWWWGDDGGGCTPTSEVKLSGYPVQTITQVKIDGVAVDPATYRLERQRYLVRVRDPANPDVVLRWPACQAMDLPDTEPGTFSVNYTFGQNPPQAGIDAAVQLACELYKQCNNLPCQLPAGTSRVVRQGVTIEKVAFVGWAWQEGRIAGQTRGWHTGLAAVDAFLNGYARAGLMRRPIFWSPSQMHRYAKLIP